MKIAIVGYGNIGKIHYEIIRKLGYEVCAVCDIIYNKIKDLNVNKYTDFTKMLAKERPDVVHICTPHYLHADMVIAALKRDVNVLCEKPLCIREEDVESILLAEKRSKGKLGVCHQNRYNEENLFVKNYLKDKKPIYGQGEMIWRRGADYYLKDEWRGKWKTEGGGVLINQALHTLDLLIWFFGEPIKIDGKIENISLTNIIEVEDTARLNCKGKNFEFDFYATNAGEKDNPITILIKTKDDDIKISGRSVLINGKEQAFAKHNEFYGKACYGTGHEPLILDFYTSIKNGCNFEINGEEAAKVVKVILSAYKNCLTFN